LVYLLKCSDGTLYTGITNDIQRRLMAHQNGKASRYTRSRLPVEIVYQEKAETKNLALKREFQIKQLRRAAKAELLAGYHNKKSKARRK